MPESAESCHRMKAFDAQKVAACITYKTNETAFIRRRAVNLTTPEAGTGFAGSVTQTSRFRNFQTF